MTILTETRERFLLAIAAQVPAERIAEIHFFQPIKQGGVESGVAVVAAWPEQREATARGKRADRPKRSGLGRRERRAKPRGASTVYSAQPLVLKGIDRGKWEASVFAEADAPLVTVDAVVRGVQRRSGDVDDATRMDGDEVRALAPGVPSLRRRRIDLERVGELEPARCSTFAPIAGAVERSRLRRQLPGGSGS